MQSYQEMSKEELLKEKEHLEAEYKKFQQRGLKLDMSRGKPSQEQLDLSMGMMDVLRCTGRNPGGESADWRYDRVQSGKYHYLRQFQLKYHVRYDFTLHDTRCDGKYAVVQA